MLDGVAPVETGERAMRARMASMEVAGVVDADAADWTGERREASRWRRASVVAEETLESADWRRFDFGGARRCYCSFFWRSRPRFMYPWNTALVSRK